LDGSWTSAVDGGVEQAVSIRPASLWAAWPVGLLVGQSIPKHDCFRNTTAKRPTILAACDDGCGGFTGNPARPVATGVVGEFIA
jgi:hypothetical protein